LAHERFRTCEAKVFNGVPLMTVWSPAKFFVKHLKEKIQLNFARVCLARRLFEPGMRLGAASALKVAT